SARKRQVIRYCPPASEHHISRVHLEYSCQRFAGVLDVASCSSTTLMNARRIGPRLRFDKFHRSRHIRMTWRSGIPVEVNRHKAANGARGFRLSVKRKQVPWNSTPSICSSHGEIRLRSPPCPRATPRATARPTPVPPCERVGEPST